jgi:asparaginyl-tRNA synthetase
MMSAGEWKAMKQWVYISDIAAHVGEEITLKGWLAGRRSSGKIHFLQFRDGTGFIQGVLGKGDASTEVFDLAGTLTQESSLELDGVVKEDPRSPSGFELGVTDVRLIHLTEEYPITRKEHGVDFLMDHRHLWLRSNRQHAIIRVRSEIEQAFRDYYYERGFVLIDSPILTPAACEGTSTLFETDYFGEPAFLSQSGQLYLEPACAAHARVYCFGPTFRAEKSKTRRHLTEFWMLEPEVAFAKLGDVCDLAEDFLVTVVARVLDRCGEELKRLERDTDKLANVTGPLPRITYTEAVDILQQAGNDFQWGGDFGAPDETVLGEKFDRPVMVTHWPAEVKAFYMERDPENPNLALGVDVIAPDGYGEIIGGGERMSNHDQLISQIREHKLPEAAFQWYLDVRKYGSVPHGGFGIGLERTVSWICGLKHVRETIPFPRMLNRLYP